MRSDITVVQETAARGARSASRTLRRVRRAFKSRPKRGAAPAQRGGQLRRRRRRFAGQPGGESPERGFGQRTRGEAGRYRERRAFEPFLDEIGEQAADAWAERPGQRLAGMAALLPEMGEQRFERRRIAAPGRRLGEAGKRPLQRFEIEGVGASIMFVEGGAATSASAAISAAATGRRPPERNNRSNAPTKALRVRAVRGSCFVFPDNLPSPSGTPRFSLPPAPLTGQLRRAAGACPEEGRVKVGSGDRAAGIALIAAAVGIVFGMAHHPTRLAEAQLAIVIHAFMIVMVWAMLFGFTHFARARGLGRPAVLAGLLAYSIGAAANIGAATVNGLVTPSLAENGVRSVGPDVFAFAWALNQALDAVAVFAIGAAYSLWSFDLLRDRTVFARVTAALGISAAAVTVGVLASGAIRMDVTGAFMVYAAQVGWAAFVGLFMLRGGLARARGGD